MGPEGVRAAGGLMAQVLPDASPATVERLEARALRLAPVARSIAAGADAWALLRMLAGEDELRSERDLALRFSCTCTLERVEIALYGLGVEALIEMASAENGSEVFCDFCRERYLIEPTAIARMIARRDA